MKTLSMIFLFATLAANAQIAIVKSSLDSGGTVVASSDTQIIYTIGESFTRENTSSSWHFSEGFISAELLNSLKLESYHQLFGVQLYPNPATDWVNISFPDTSNNIEISCYDLNGKKINLSYIKILENASNEITIQLDDLPSAVYSILLIDHQNKKYKYLKLIKI